MSDRTLGSQIKAAREKRGWSQKTLADKLKIVSLTVIRWEQDKSIPRQDVRKNLSELLDLEEEIFLLAKKPYARDREVVPDELEDQKNLSNDNEEPRVDYGPTEFIEFTIPSMKMYWGWGERDDTSGPKWVTVDGQPLPYVHFDRSGYVIADPVGHFSWGYTGRGPANLALSILADYFGETPLSGEARREVRQAWKYHYNFKMDFVAWFEKKSWEISSWAIDAWLREQQEEGDPAPEHTLSDVKDGWRGWSERWDKYNPERNSR